MSLRASTREKVCLFIEWTIPAAFKREREPIFIVHSRHDFSLRILVNGTSWLTRISTYFPRNHWWWFCQGKKEPQIFKDHYFFLLWEQPSFMGATLLLPWSFLQKRSGSSLRDYHTLEKNGVSWDVEIKESFCHHWWDLLSALHFQYFWAFPHPQLFRFPKLGDVIFQFIVKT